VSVVVCTCNGALTLAETCHAIARLDYPDFEAIVVDDGSTDASAEIARGFGFGVISTENRGLSSARNTGLEAATGEIVAYIDDDAIPARDWLNHLVHVLERPGVAAAGGPNLPVAGDGAVADAVAVAPGNAEPVRISAHEAEHVPGCNCAFDAHALRAIGGFDERFRSAGDDVDICWRLRETGSTIGYDAAAVVFHHRRSTVRRYLRQQRGYGMSEALLSRKWPERYTVGGHAIPPAGSRAQRSGSPGRLCRSAFGRVWNEVVLSPEMYLILAALIGLAGLGMAWSPLLWLAPAATALLGSIVIRASVCAMTTALPTSGLSTRQVVFRRIVAGLLVLAQPLARQAGRLRHGLTPWRHIRVRAALGMIQQARVVTTHAQRGAGLGS
jgi:GT2 family glycosyltransferase